MKDGCPDCMTEGGNGIGGGIDVQVVAYGGTAVWS
jgi:hypothetical protein